MTRLRLLAAIGAVVLAGALAAWWLSRGTDSAPVLGVEADPTELTPLQIVLREIDDDGNWSRETALRAVAATFGPLPGVDVPVGIEPASQFGDVSLHLIAPYFGELDREMQDAILEAVGPLGGELEYLRDAAVAARPRPTDIPVALSTDEYQQLVDHLIPQIEARVGHGAGLPIEVVLESEQIGKLHGQAVGQIQTVNGEATYVGCAIHLFPLTQIESGKNMTAILAHEIWHCFQKGRVKHPYLKPNIAPWIIEGQAMWVGEAIAGGANVPDKTVRYWTDYLLHPELGLFSRSYDAIGFYSHLDDAGTDPFKGFDAMLVASSNEGALQAALGSAEQGLEVIGTWGASWFRDASPTPTFALIKAPGIPSAEVRPDAEMFTIGSGESRIVDSGGTLRAALAEFSVEADILIVDVRGSAVIGDLVYGRDLPFIAVTGSPYYPGTATPFCVRESCECPDGTPGPTDLIGHLLRAGVTGDQIGASSMKLTGWSLDDWCHEPEPTSDGGGSPCAFGCGSSNGDPHLTTINGVSYDLQAAGEFVLLRSADGAFELQARQEPYRDSEYVAINTAIAIRDGSERVAFYAGGGVRVNGALTPLAGDITVGELRARPGAEAIEVERSDGTTVWVIDLGEWGLNVVVAPSEELASGGVGLLATTDAEDRPRLPDGSSIDPEADYFEAIYGVLADAWAVTAETSLFDYAPGEGPATYRDASFPVVGGPLSVDDLSEVLRQLGFEACADMEDDVLQSQCAFDVAVTGDGGFVDGYVVTQTIVSPPQTGSIAGGELTPVLQDVAVISGAAMAPNGTLYLAARFEDQHAEIVALDPRAQTVIARTTTADSGPVGFAAGSVWAGTSETDCALRRLDPRTLDEQARVPVRCMLGFLPPPFATALDAVWYYDTSAATAEAPAQLRRIDPDTNAPADAVPVPFGNGYVRGTEDALFYSDIDAGTYVWHPGVAAFVALPVEGLFGRPSGDGIWDQAGEELRLIDAGGTVTRSFQSRGRLVGATRSAALVQLDGADGIELWAFPNDGSGSARVAVGPIVGTEGQRRQLDYTGDEPTFVSGAVRGVTRYWLLFDASGGPSAVYVQWVGLR